MFVQPLGHQPLQAQLAQLLAQGKMPHAVLLHGPQGVGKATLARWLAARLICGAEGAATRNPLQPNKTSPQWAQLQAESCPDFHVLQKNKSTIISVKDDIPPFLAAMRRSADGAKVGIIDSIDDFNTHSANSILKLLEEPMPGTYLILVCHQLSNALPTIRSRSRLMKVGLLSEPETAAVLAAQGADMAEAALAKGSPGLWRTQTAAQKAARNGLLNGILPAASTAGLLPLLASHIATLPPSYAHARLHQQLMHLHTQQQTINLPSTLVNEQALALIKPILSLTTPN
jgi:hypothetical protein